MQLTTITLVGTIIQELFYIIFVKKINYTSIIFRVLHNLASDFLAKYSILLY